MAKQSKSKDTPPKDPSKSIKPKVLRDQAPLNEEKLKRHKSKGSINFHSVIFKVFKQARENGNRQIKISKDTVHVLNTIVHDFVQRIGEEAGRLCKYSHRHTMTTRDVAAAVKLVVVTNELCTLLCKGGDDAVKTHAHWLAQHGCGASRVGVDEE
eukprot:Blabericola_migrator_1__246@NODE_1065_length_5548_cov_186_921182_g732_i0_p5_GENE_NODE_1065_length_5548_cov_186_921182_g732_i0NODE_1065_length_5548_cov_186_921182_g732_i0_p5_ORF_typecomplete_len155_score32_69Histone/PF00125_24/1e11CBFD_NFYB_HMF/PF00808_23/2_6e06CENPT_C/PF15511_6/3_6e06TFIID18kDa/PF02269_16/0_00079TFIID_20kDa/PF03847_13/0_0044TAF/PF02969_17/0_0042CENPS/PF15630_6/0_0048BLM10_mid/PF16507_5/0_025Bromo_TP/PF07524_13/0_032Creatinase_N/PF01321_18/0_027_NODE_1065_length_5548_cov_186_9211